MKRIQSHTTDPTRRMIGGWSIVNGDWLDYDYRRDLDIDMIGDGRYRFGGDAREYTMVHNGDFSEENVMHKYAVINELLRKKIHPGDMASVTGKAYRGLNMRPYMGKDVVCRRILDAYQYALLAILNGFTVHGIWERDGAVYVPLNPVAGEKDVFEFAKCWGTLVPSRDPFAVNTSHTVETLFDSQMEALLFGYSENYAFTPINFDQGTSDGAEHVFQFKDFKKSYALTFTRDSQLYAMHRYDQHRLVEERGKRLDIFNDMINDLDVVCPTLFNPIRPLSEIPEYARWAIISDTLCIFDHYSNIKTIGQYLVYNKSNRKIIGGGAFLANNFAYIM